MTASPGSASGGPSQPPPDDRDGVLVCGPNWLGDSVMAMPALHEFAQRNPAADITMLVKPGLSELWRMHSAVASVIELHDWPAGVLSATVRVGGIKFDRAYVLPHSFRASLVPFLAGVPDRVGLPGHSRDWMLTTVIASGEKAAKGHQMLEYAVLMGLSEGGDLTGPQLNIPADVMAQCRDSFANQFGDQGDRCIVGVVPGAARGPSKRWPAQRFAEVARRLAADSKCAIAAFGQADDRETCAAVLPDSPACTANFAGETNLQQFAGMLSLCDVVVTNDSGGMHLASAVGTKVVAVFGLTDPVKTGPIGTGHRTIKAVSDGASRDVPRESAEALRALESIAPEAVYDAVVETLGK